MRNFQENFSLGIDFTNVSFKTTRINHFWLGINDQPSPIRQFYSSPFPRRNKQLIIFLFLFGFLFFLFYHLWIDSNFPLFRILNESIFIQIKLFLGSNKSHFLNRLAIHFFSNSLEV